MVFLQGCEIDIEPTSISGPTAITLRPNKFPDVTMNEYIYSDTGGVGVLNFVYTENDLPQVSNEELPNVEIRFRIEPADGIENDPANNVLSNGYAYSAEVNGTLTSPIPRPVGRLSNYVVRLKKDQRIVSVGYIASDVSGIYRVIGEAYYKGSLVTAKTSMVYVKIPDLREFDRKGYDSHKKMLWNFVGETEFHISNNYVQFNKVGYALSDIAIYIVDTYAKNHNGDSNFIVRMTDASLPWGGMFWIGYTEDTDLSINRVDGYGNPYTITYKAYIHHRIYAPPHRTHRDGRNVDISSYSDDGSGNKDTSKYLSFDDIQEAVSNYNKIAHMEVWSVIKEADHYHLTCNIASNYYYPYEY
jgi:hypothetical protein